MGDKFREGGFSNQPTVAKHLLVRADFHGVDFVAPFERVTGSGVSKGAAACERVPQQRFTVARSRRK